MILAVLYSTIRGSFVEARCVQQNGCEDLACKMSTKSHLCTRWRGCFFNDFVVIRYSRQKCRVSTISVKVIGRRHKNSRNVRILIIWNGQKTLRKGRIWSILSSFVVRTAAPMSAWSSAVGFSFFVSIWYCLLLTSAKTNSSRPLKQTPYFHSKTNSSLPLRQTPHVH